MDYSNYSVKPEFSLLWTSPLADKHYDVARKEQEPMTVRTIHWIVGSIEKIPVLSLIVTIFDLAVVHFVLLLNSVVVSIKNKLSSPTPPQEIPEPPKRKDIIGLDKKIILYTQGRNYGKGEIAANETLGMLQDENDNLVTPLPLEIEKTYRHLTKTTPSYIDGTLLAGIENTYRTATTPPIPGQLSYLLPLQPFETVSFPSPLESDEDGKRYALGVNGVYIDCLKFNPQGNSAIYGINRENVHLINNKRFFPLPQNWQTADTPLCQRIKECKGITQKLHETQEVIKRNQKVNEQVLVERTFFCDADGNRLKPEELDLAAYLLVDIIPPEKPVIVTQAAPLNLQNYVGVFDQVTFMDHYGRLIVQLIESQFNAGVGKKNKWIEEHFGVIPPETGAFDAIRKGFFKGFSGPPLVPAHAETGNNENAIHNMIWTPFGMGTELHDYFLNYDWENGRLIKINQVLREIRALAGEATPFLKNFIKTHMLTRRDEEFKTLCQDEINTWGFSEGQQEKILKLIMEEGKFDPTKLKEVRAAMAKEFVNALALVLKNNPELQTKKIHICLPDYTEDMEAISEAMLDALLPKNAQGVRGYSSALKREDAANPANAYNYTNSIVIYTNNSTVPQVPETPGIREFTGTNKLAQDMADQLDDFSVSVMQEVSPSVIGGNYVLNPNKKTDAKDLTNTIRHSPQQIQLLNVIRKLECTYTAAVKHFTGKEIPVAPAYAYGPAHA